MEYSPKRNDILIARRFRFSRSLSKPILWECNVRHRTVLPHYPDGPPSAVMVAELPAVTEAGLILTLLPAALAYMGSETYRVVVFVSSVDASIHAPAPASASASQLSSRKVAVTV